MPKVLSQEFFIEKFRSKSLILGPAQGHGKTRNPIYGISEAKALLAEILDKQVDPAKGHLGFLESAKHKAREARAAWEKHNKAQPVHARKDKPHDIFLEKINKAKARVEIIGEECRALNKLIEEHEGQEENEQATINKKLQRRKPLAGKLKNGILFQMDGRVVIEGGTKFEDDGQLVTDYIASVKKERAEFRKARNAVQAKQVIEADRFVRRTGLRA